MPSLPKSLLLWPLLLAGLAACSKSGENDGSESTQSPLEMELANLVSEFDNRTVYTSLDAETLAAIPDEWLVQAIVDYVSARTGGDVASNRDSVDALPPAVRGVFASYWLEAEVYGDGFEEYFQSEYGYWVADAIAAYSDYGAFDHAKVTGHAVALYLERTSDGGEFRSIESLEAIPAPGDDTDIANTNAGFWGLTDPSRQRVAYIRANPDKFTSGQ